MNLSENISTILQLYQIATQPNYNSIRIQLSGDINAAGVKQGDPSVWCSYVDGVRWSQAWDRDRLQSIVYWMLSILSHGRPLPHCLKIVAICAVFSNKRLTIFIMLFVKSIFFIMNPNEFLYLKKSFSLKVFVRCQIWFGR